MELPERRRGFTLVELLVVIGIIAVLVAILLPALKKARDAANEAVCMSGLRQFGVGFQVYADSNQGFLPEDGPDGTNSTDGAIGRKSPNSPPYDDNGFYLPTGVDDPALWYNAIPPLVNNKSWYDMYTLHRAGKQPMPAAGNNSIWSCPTAGQPASLFGSYVDPDTLVKGNDEIDPQPPNAQTTAQDGQNYYQLWGKDKGRLNFITYPFYMCYVMNSKLFTTVSAPGQQPVNVTRVKLAQLHPGSSVPIMVEKIMQYGEYNVPEIYRWPGKANLQTPGPSVKGLGYTGNIGQTKATGTRFAARHRKGGFLLFADGHVSWFAWTQVQGIIRNNNGQGQLYDINRQDQNVIWCPYGPTD
jgi:prepilin-type N-terminal cleavage/methylation domain-containing protein/prepilin-type processing-associated H-X9-DG protein